MKNSMLTVVDYYHTFCGGYTRIPESEISRQPVVNGTPHFQCCRCGKYYFPITEFVFPETCEPGVVAAPLPVTQTGPVQARRFTP